MDLNTLTQLWSAADAENKANQDKVINYVKGINATVNGDVEIHVAANVESNRDRTVYIEFVKPDGKEAFGADINFRVSQDYSFKTGEYGEVEFSMGCSTMGRVSRAEAPYQVCRCYLMAELWKREQDTIKLFDTLTYDAYKAASKAQQEYDREQREIERAAEQKLAAEINDKIKIGYTFSESWKYRDTTETADFVVEKITPKRCYLKYTKHEPETRYFYDPELQKRTKLNHGILHSTFTGYINIEKLQHILLRQAQGETGLYVISSLDGVNRTGYEFEIQSTENIPESEQW